MNLSFWGNSAWAGIGLAVNGLCQWSVIALLARLTDPFSLGSYSLANAVTTPLFVLSHAGQRTLMVNGADNGTPLTRHVLLRFTTGSLAWLATMIYALASGFDGMATAMLAWVGVSKLADSLLDASLGAYQRASRMDLAARAQMTQGILPFALFAATLWWTAAALPAVFAWALSRLLLSLEQARSAMKFEGGEGPPCQLIEWWPLLTLGFPLACGSALALLAASLPRFLLEAVAGRTAVGLFAAAASFELAGAMLTMAAAQTAAPRLSACYLSGNEQGFRQLLQRVSGVAALVGLAGVLASAITGKWLLALLFGSAYANEAPTLVILMAASGLSSINLILSIALSARRVMRTQPLLLLPALAVGATVGLILISEYHIAGAAWTAVAISVTQMIALSGALFASRLKSGHGVIE